MRVIHFADLHLGVDQYGKPVDGKPWSSRMQGFLDAFDYLVDYALAEGVDAVLVAGDAYKSREPTQTQQREFARRIRRLSEAGVATFLLPGNHDLPNAEGRAHVLQIYDTLGVPNVVVGDDSGWGEGIFDPMVLTTRSGPLQVAVMPWPRVSHIVGQAAAAGMSWDQVRQEAERLMTEAIARQAQALDPGLPAVLAAHISLNTAFCNANPGSEKAMTWGTAPTLLPTALAAPNFDYIALGHFHRPMELSLSTPGWFSGSMQPIDFDDTGPRGFLVLDIDVTKARGGRVAGSGLPRLVEAPGRKLLTVDVRPREADPTPEACAAVERADVADQIVQVVIRVTDDQLRELRLPEVRKALADAHYVAGVRVIRPSESSSTTPLGIQLDIAKPLEALETYFKTRSTISDGRREQLLNAARDLIETAGG